MDPDGRSPAENPYRPPETPLHERGRPIESSPDDVVATIIPYKNAAALTAYYLGIFSCFPFVGLLLAIAALVLGVMGLRNVGRDPQIKGRVHAWVGLIGGTIGLLINGFLIRLVIVLLGGISPQAIPAPTAGPPPAPAAGPVTPAGEGL